MLYTVLDVCSKEVYQFLADDRVTALMVVSRLVNHGVISQQHVLYPKLKITRTVNEFGMIMVSAE